MSKGRKLPRRVGDASNGSDKSTYDGPEGVHQSHTVSLPAVAPGQSIPTRVIASADPPTLYAVPVSTLSLSDRHCKPSVSTCMKLCVNNCCSMKEKTRLPYILYHVRDNKCDLVALTETWMSPTPMLCRNVQIMVINYFISLALLEEEAGLVF